MIRVDYYKDIIILNENHEILKENIFINDFGKIDFNLIAKERFKECKYEESLYLFEKNLEIPSISDLEKLKNLNNVCICCILLSYYNKALEYNNKCMDLISEKNLNNELINKVNYNHSLLLMIFNKFDESKNFIKKIKKEKDPEFNNLFQRIENLKCEKNGIYNYNEMSDEYDKKKNVYHSNYVSDLIKVENKKIIALKDIKEGTLLMVSKSFVPSVEKDTFIIVDHQKNKIDQLYNLKYKVHNKIINDKEDYKMFFDLNDKDGSENEIIGFKIFFSKFRSEYFSN
jgi:tetratricopeptide (TPR) repeat protein